jgi:hypothetical protein
MVMAFQSMKYVFGVMKSPFGAGCSTLASKARPFLGSFLFAKNVLPKNASTNGGDASRVGIEKGEEYKLY